MVPGKGKSKITLDIVIISIYFERFHHVGVSSTHQLIRRFLFQIKFKCLKTKEQFNLRCGRYLQQGQDDNDTWRELALVAPGQKPLPSMIVCHDHNLFVDPLSILCLLLFQYCCCFLFSD